MSASIGSFMIALETLRSRIRSPLSGPTKLHFMNYDILVRIFRSRIGVLLLSYYWVYEDIIGKNEVLVKRSGIIKI